MYTATGWCAKNKGFLPTEMVSLLVSSDSPLVSSLFTDAADSSAATADKAVSSPTRPAAKPALAEEGRKKKAAATVLGRFRQSLRELFATLDGTAARYVRCIKPNAAKVADRYDGRYVERQLLYNGVLAIVEIQSAGYAISLLKPNFLARYRCCCPRTLPPEEAAALAAAASDPNLACTTLLSAAQRTLGSAGPAAGASSTDWLSTHDAQLGKTKVFLREAVLLHTYIHTYVLYVRTYIHTYIHTCIHRSSCERLCFSRSSAPATLSRLPHPSRSPGRAGACLRAMRSRWPCTCASCAHRYVRGISRGLAWAVVSMGMLHTDVGRAEEGPGLAVRPAHRLTPTSPGPSFAGARGQDRRRCLGPPRSALCMHCSGREQLVHPNGRRRGTRAMAKG